MLSSMVRVALGRGCVVTASRGEAGLTAGALRTSPRCRPLRLCSQQPRGPQSAGPDQHGSACSPAVGIASNLRVATAEQPSFSLGETETPAGSHRKPANAWPQRKRGALGLPPSLQAHSSSLMLGSWEAGPCPSFFWRRPRLRTLRRRSWRLPHAVTTASTARRLASHEATYSLLPGLREGLPCSCVTLQGCSSNFLLFPAGIVARIVCRHASDASFTTALTSCSNTCESTACDTRDGCCEDADAMALKLGGARLDRDILQQNFAQVFTRDRARAAEA